MVIVSGKRPYKLTSNDRILMVEGQFSLVTRPQTNGVSKTYPKVTRAVAERAIKLGDLVACGWRDGAVLYKIKAEEESNG